MRAGTIVASVFNPKLPKTRLSRPLADVTLRHSSLLRASYRPQIRRARFAGPGHGERNHQGLRNKIINPSDEVGAIAGKIECREHLGGLLKYYHRAAA